MHQLRIWLEDNNYDSDAIYNDLVDIDYDNDSNIYCYFVNELIGKMNEYDIIKIKIKKYYIK